MQNLILTFRNLQSVELWSCIKLDSAFFRRKADPRYREENKQNVGDKFEFAGREHELTKVLGASGFGSVFALLSRFERHRRVTQHS